MIEDKELSKKQISRLSGLDQFPREREAILELVFALQNFATQQQAESFITDWLSTAHSCPKPADIRIAARDAKVNENLGWLEKKQCPHCYGSGYRMVIRQQRAMPSMQVMDYEFAEKCNHQDRGCDHARNAHCGPAPRRRAPSSAARREQEGVA
jgi:hypothetical protein